MSEKKIKELVRRRGVLKGKLTVFTAYLTAFDISSGIDQLQTRLDKLEETWTTFQEVQGELEVIDENLDNAQAHENERMQFEESYYQNKGAAMRILRESTPRSVTPNAAVPAVACNPNIKLPALNLKTFSGNYEEWIEFADTFTGSIDKYPGLPNVQKLFYLRSCLTGKAAEIIRSLESTDENYAIAWDLLKENYESKRLIVQKHAKICELPTVARESADGLHSLYNSAQGHIRALKAMEQSTDSWGALLLHIMTSKLDKATLQAWERKITGKDVPTLDEFWTFIKEHCQMLEAMSIDSSSTSTRNQSRNFQSSKPTNVHHAYVTTANGRYACFVCNQEHNIQSCEEFASMTNSERMDIVKKSRVCFNCLRAGHVVSTCNASRCRKCNRKHHTLLHDANINIPTELVDNETNSIAALQAFVASQILLTTALVDVVDNSGRLHACRVLLDNGSQANFMTAELAHKLRIPQRQVRVPVSGFNDKLTYTKGTVQSIIKSRCSSYEVKLTFLVTPRIVEQLPAQQVDTSALDLPKNLKLADPCFHRPDTIDALLGAEVFYQLLCVGQIRLSKNAMLQKTQLCWIVAGNMGNASKVSSNVTTCLLTTAALESQVKKFWELKQIPAQTFLSTEEKLCEEHFVKHTTRTDKGRYIVRLPFNENKECLGESLNMARKRLISQERRLARDVEIQGQYNAFLAEFESLGHMAEVQSAKLSRPSYYIPHQAVLKEDGLTTKLRVVFDASMKTSNGISLNDALMVGATLQPDVFSILVRFRTYNVALVADVEKMYRQVRVQCEDTPYQRVLWRSNYREPIKLYELKTLTYGTASASFLAIRTLFRLAEDEGSSLPRASRVIRQEMYVDDVLTGAESTESPASLRDELITLLAKGGFNLRKWASNTPKLLDSFSKSKDQYLCLDSSSKLKTLGISWFPEKDQLLYAVKEVKNNRITKRTILSELATLFDPLGLIGPVIVTAKILLQSLWKVQLGWDEGVSLEAATKWTHFRHDLPKLEQLRVDRKTVVAECRHIQLHGFCDASENAYGACIYLRSEDVNGRRKVNLVCSKSRVAPLKQQTIPRLELCTAQLLAEVVQVVKSVLQLEINETYLWTDSMISVQ